MTNKRLIIYQPWGGLGDNLQYSTLPEELTKKGYDVYVHTNNAYRNDEIRQLVWDYNPYIKGYTDDCNDISELSIKEIYDCSDNHVSTIEKLHGVTSDSKYPKIYYNPTKIPDFIDKVIVECNSITVEPRHLKISIPDAIYINDPVVPSYKTSSIFELCDIIYSCKEIHTAHSGLALLASAIKRLNETLKVYEYLPTYWYNHYINNKLMFWFDNHTYIEYKGA